MEVLLYGVWHARKIAHHPAMDPFRGEELVPGRHLQSDREIEEYIRDAAAGLFHCACTCRMGWDRMSVVDPSLRVHGLQGLRIADASVMPDIVSGNTNAASVMIGEKAAEAIVNRPEEVVHYAYAGV